MKAAFKMDDSDTLTLDSSKDVSSPFKSPTFERDVQIRVNDTVGSASVSPCGRDVVVASREGLHIIDLDFPHSLPRHLSHYSPWEVADVQWSPFGARDHWVVSTSNQKALVWNLNAKSSSAAIEHTLHAHSRAITDINFSAFELDILATCAVDSYVHCWDLRRPQKPAMTFADWNAGATQVKWNRQDPNILASSHDRFLRIWDRRKGAYPLKSIEAHHTKIYGIDWNRTKASSLLTCSLDKTIKLWDYEKDDDEPDRVIRTNYPVWRARHTPFGWGILAMPQRGDFGLHLYDRRLNEDTPRDGFVRPAHSFEGHDDQVKEFLWRARGDIDDGIDDRDFQLISWGVDRTLRLHRIESRHLRAAGFVKGEEVHRKLVITRKGAEYRTFRNEPAKEVSDQAESSSDTDGLSKLPYSIGMSKTPLLFGAPYNDRGFALSSATMYGRKAAQRDDPVEWLAGVKIGRKRAQTIDTMFPRPSISRTSMSDGSPQDEQEKLSEEITMIAGKYQKVDFEEADIERRLATIGLNGPWAADAKSVFLRITLKFPESYPRFAMALFTLERTTSAIPDDVIDKLNRELRVLIEHYGDRREGCLEAIVTYLLGDRSLEQSIRDADQKVKDGFLLAHTDESSSDDDDEEVGVNGGNMENSGSGTLKISPAQANTPLPKHCGAYFANDGRLVCFFPPKEQRSGFDLDMIRNSEHVGKHSRHLEGLGRLYERSPSSRDLARRLQDEESSEESSTGSWTSTSSSSDGSEFEDIARLPDRFGPPSAWRAAALRNYKASSHASGGQSKATQTLKSKSVVSIRDLTDLTLASRSLADSYRLFGSGPEICEHNAGAARQHGLENIARVWDICATLLYDKVPLKALDQPLTKGTFLTVAMRNVVCVKSKLSGFAVKFDDPPAVAKPMCTGRVKWGMHPLAQTWLIPQLFEHFERLADIQMLAMLACVLCEPPRTIHTLTTLGAGIPNLPMHLQAPALSLPYFANADVADSSVQAFRNLALLTSPLLLTGEVTADYFSRLPVSGPSLTSSVQWPEGLAPGSQHGTPYSAGNTPPIPSKQVSQYNSFEASLSSSPEMTGRLLRKSTSQLTNALANLTRPFSTNASTSPDDRYKQESELSSSAPSGIRWGINTIISGASTPSPEKRRRPSGRRSSEFTFDDSAYSSEDEEFDVVLKEAVLQSKENTPPEPVEATRLIRVKLRNQEHFDLEAQPSVPLLDPTRQLQYAAYREMYAEQLSIWGLEMVRAEVLKFNGLASLKLEASDRNLTTGASSTIPTFATRVIKGDKTPRVMSRSSSFQAVGSGSFCRSIESMLM